MALINDIRVAAGDIWLTVDQQEGIDLETLFNWLENAGKNRDALYMALGWLIYQKYVKWGKSGRLSLVNQNKKEELKNAEPNQNRFAAYRT